MSAGLDIHLIQEIRREVELIKQLLTDLEPKTKATTRVLREEIGVLTAIMALSRKMFGSDEYGRILANIQRTIATILLMKRTYEMAMASMGPFGMALAAISAVGTAYSIGDIVGSYG